MLKQMDGQMDTMNAQPRVLTVHTARILQSPLDPAIFH